ncbi:hypothetical protein [Streptomyces sp. JJ36]|uniref:hypothetical protein n=1 Tax=Streptomyces sp. JJ36 TaxID=2736645 RepID=UPI001F337A1A|nr:hypothetical protein [Streptomyces sp. JJ36]MCF6524213.1 hypothetical protein [Streptomyces sp. JJ36]
MPGSRRRALSLTTALLALHAALTGFATRSAAAPTEPDPDVECEDLYGPARDHCTGDAGDDSRRGADVQDPTGVLDPLSSLAKGCAEAASWTIRKLSQLVNETTRVDFTNEAFLRQYAVVFAASTILTLVLWLLAVAKRAVRGVPFVEAITEAVGFLWLVVLASAFTPLILYTVVTATDAVTEAVSSGSRSDTDAFFGTFAEALEKGEGIGGGPIMLIVVSLISIVAASVLYLELVVRAALLYVGALLGTAVYAGLVDKNLWGHVRRWAGIMIAVILVKPVIMIVLTLAGALAADDGPDAFSAIVSGLAIILLAIFASAMIYRFVPGFGDDIVQHRNASQDAASRTAVAAVASPASLLRQGITTHGARGGGTAAQSASGDGGAASRPANPASGGVAAHSTRGGGEGGGSPAPAAPPAPRESTDTPHRDRPAHSRTPHSSRTSGGDRG